MTSTAEPIVYRAGRGTSGGEIDADPITLELFTGGGGGYGRAAERDPAAVHADVREGYVSEESARREYPHGFEGDGVA